MVPHETMKFCKFWFLSSGISCISTSFLWYSQLPPCGHPTITDTWIIRTAAKSQAKINYRCLTEINSRYYGLLLMRTLTQDPHSVRNKGSWLYSILFYSILGLYYYHKNLWSFLCCCISNVQKQGDFFYTMARLKNYYKVNVGVRQMQTADLQTGR